MSRSLLLLAASVTLTVAGCAADAENDDQADGGVTEDATEPADPVVPVEVSTDLLDPEGSVVGTAWFRDDDGRAMVEVQVAGLTEGFHPMYLVEAGTCDPEQAAADDPAATELPALLVLENGVGSMSTLAGPMSLDDLLAEQGTALVITQAVGALSDVPAAEDVAFLDTGSQVACGAIEG